MPQYSAQDTDLFDEHTLAAMREWIDDCYWGDLELMGDASDLTDQEVIDGVNRHYSGGVSCFLGDLETGNGELP